MKDTECYVNKAEVKRKIRVWLDYRTSRQVTDGLLDLIEKLPVTVKGQLEATLESEWISVRDRLPEVGEHVLVFSPVTGIKNDFVAFVENHEEDRFFLSGRVTHWMPLPQKPESEDDVE